MQELPRENLMQAIGTQNDDLEKHRERLREMTDKQLLERGRACRVHVHTGSESGETASGKFCHPLTGSTSRMGKKTRETSGEDVDKRQVLRVLLSFLWPTTLLDKFLALLIRPGGDAPSGLL